MRFVIRLLGTMLGIWVTTLLISGIYISEGTSLTERLLILAGVALVLTLVNSLVRPVLTVVAFPLYLITFGLFALVTNAVVYMITGWAATSLGLPFIVGGFWPALLGGTITAIISSVTVAILGKEDKN